MFYQKFKIKEYKGIEEVNLDLSNSKILTLVGLNESGKTTILESINWFYKLIKGYTPTGQEINSFRPKEIAFTGVIEMSSILILEEDDIKQLEGYWKSLNKRKKLEIPKEFSCNFRLHFNVSEYNKIEDEYEFSAKSISAKRNLHDTDYNSWKALVDYIKTQLIPEILFYEDFIFNIPDQIKFLNNPTEDQQIKDELDKQLNKQWQLVLNDILKTVDSRFSSFQEYVGNKWNSDNDSARGRITAMEGLLNDKITNAWKELFQKGSKKLNFKEIKLVPTPEGNYLNVSFKVKTDDNKEFSINERSKGCKWFFSFLLFTEFRKTRTKNILFLLDEPASNLHSSAQVKILEAIEELGKDSMVIYTTHSHHLINPKWLAGAYIIINETITENRLEGDITFDEGAKITAERYFNYVGKGLGSTKMSYYQPILDRLDYAPSAVEPIPEIVITEGRDDWYTFQYFNKIIFSGKYKIKFYPGAGKDQLWEPIRIYLSWGKKFLVILDGDEGGKKSKETYLREFDLFVQNKIFTLEDITKQKFEIEDLINVVDMKNIIDTVFGKGTYDSGENNQSFTKSKINLAIKQLLVNKTKITIHKNTKDNFQKLFKFITKKLSD